LRSESSGWLFFCLVLSLSSLALFEVPAHCSEARNAAVVSGSEPGLLVKLQSALPELSWRDTEVGSWDVITMPGCESIDEPGKPDLPFLGFLVAIPFECEPSVTLESVGADELFGFRIAPCDKPVSVETNGTVMVERRFAIDECLFATNAYYPNAIVQAEYAGVFRGQHLARIMVFPVRHNPVLESLEIVRRLTFRLHFDGEMPESGSVGVRCAVRGPSLRALDMVRTCVGNPEDVRAIRVPDAPAPNDATPLVGSSSELKMTVTEDGIYCVIGSDLLATGIDISTINPEKLAVRYLGQDVAILVADGGDGSFDLSDYLVFWGEAPESLFTNDNVYWLALDADGAARMAVVDASAGDAPFAESFVCTQHLEEDNVYWQTMPDGAGEDHWFWTLMEASGATVFTFEIHNLSGQEFDASIEIELRGRSDAFQEPDHHTRLFLNGVLIDDQYWDGCVKFSHMVTVPQSLLRTGENELRIEYPGDTGAFVDKVYLNCIDIAYLASFLATQGVIRFRPRIEGRRRFNVSGFSSDEIHVFDITDSSAPRYLGNTGVQHAGNSFMVDFEADVSFDSELLVIQSSCAKAVPSIALDSHSSLKSSANRADYVIISHGDFLEAVQGIARHHAANGEIVLVADIKDPAAIKDFLSYAYHNFAGPPPADVLLVGDANIDYKDNLKTGAIDFVPTHLFDSEFLDRLGQTPTDNWLVCVDGDDILPDMNIGRICAKTSRDVEAVLAKIQAYDNGQARGDWLSNVLFVAGSDGQPVNMELDEQHLPDEYETAHLNIHDFASGQEAKDAIILNLDGGCLLVNYAGHGNITSWEGGMLSSGDITLLENHERMPFLLAFTCLNGAFAYWTPDCLAELLVNAPNKGCIACFASTSVDTMANHRILAVELYDGIFRDFNCYLGSSTTAAKVRAYASAGYSVGFSEMIETFTLFGDPGLALAVPTAPPEPRLTVWTDKETYYADQTINVDVMLENTGGASVQVDAYLALDYNGTLLYYPSFGLEPAPIPVDLPAFLKLRLRAASLAVPNPSPAGTYAFYAALTQPGDISQILGGIDAATFEVR